MMYRLKKDLGELKQGSVVEYAKGFFVSGDATFDPMDVLGDTEHFEEVHVSTEASYVAVETV